MSDLKLPGENEKSGPSFTRVAIWIVVGAIGLYMVLSGLVGALN